jgi:DNA-binding winged helix-turn-helix (wHTH) protein
VQAEIIKFDEFELDLGRYELRRQGQPLKLEKIPMELLILLAGREGQLVTREEIIERLWGSNVYVDTRQGINTAIRKIRLALKDDPDDPRVLLTVVGKGYRLVAPIVTFETEIEAKTPASSRALAGQSESPGVAAAPKVAEAGALTVPAASKRPPADPQPDARPVIDPRLARALFLMIQAGYLTLYGVVFAHLSQIQALRLPSMTPALTLIAGLIGAAIHLYLTAAVAFNYPGSGRLFRQVFPALLAIDVLWAGSPLFLFERWGELTLLFFAALAFLPFSQRTLMRSAYGSSAL